MRISEFRVVIRPWDMMDNPSPSDYMVRIEVTTPDGQIKSETKVFPSDHFSTLFDLMMDESKKLIKDHFNHLKRRGDYNE